MDWQNLFFAPDEKPLDRFPEGISNTAIFRTMAFVGDSLSSGEFVSRGKDNSKGYHDYFEYSWGQFIARKNGLTAYNFSRGGMTAKEYMTSYADANRFFQPEKAAQAYVIALGVNDVLNAGQEIGSIADIDIEDYRNNKDTFAGYYAAIIQRYKKIQPRAKFFLVTMPKGERKEDKVRAHRELLYAFADFFENTYVIDLYQYGPEYDDAFKKRFFLYGHMNPMGYLFTANIVDAYIDYIIRKNPEDFYRVPYIGTELE